MSLKKKIVGLGALSCLFMISGCVTKTSDKKTGSETKTDVKSSETDDKFIKLSVEQKEKPTFDGYLETYDEQDQGRLKFYYFNIGKADGVPISTSESYRYTGIDIDVSYTITSATEEGVEKTIEEATQKTVASSVMEGMCITKGEEDSSTQTASFSLENSMSSSLTVAQSFTVTAGVEASYWGVTAKAEASSTTSVEATVSASVTNTASWGEEFSKTKSVSQANSVESTKTREESKSIANAFSTYSNSQYSESTTVQYHLAGDIEKGWYRYALFSLCDVYLVITLDENNNKAYINYTMYPVADSFYYGIQYSNDGKYNETLEDKISVNIEDVLDYLNYDPYSGLNKVIFDANGGVTQMKRQYVKPNSKLGEIKTPTRENYLFVGWYTDKECNTAFNLDTEITADIILYAKWAPVTYTITYNLNGGTNNPSNVSQFTIEDEIILKDPSRTDYTFIGWYTDANFQNKIEKIEKGTKEGIKLYAKWQQAPKSYKLSFASDIDTSAYHITTTPGEYTAGTTITLSLVRKGNITYKWFDDDTNQELSSTFIMPEKNIKIRVDYTYQ